VFRQIGHPWPVAGGKRPCFPPCFKKGIKAKFGYDSRKGLLAVFRGPSQAGLLYQWSQPGTQCHTSATSLRKQLANFRVSDQPQTRGSEQGCEVPPLRQGRRIWREPRSPEIGVYTVSLLCVVCTERCVTQVPEFGYDDRKGVGACERGPSGLGDRRTRRSSWRSKAGARGRFSCATFGTGESSPCSTWAGKRRRGTGGTPVSSVAGKAGDGERRGMYGMGTFWGGSATYLFSYAIVINNR